MGEVLAVGTASVALPAVGQMAVRGIPFHRHHRLKVIAQRVAGIPHVAKGVEGIVVRIGTGMGVVAQTAHPEVVSGVVGKACQRGTAGCHRVIAVGAGGGAYLAIGHHISGACGRSLPLHCRAVGGDGGGHCRAACSGHRV